MIRDRLRRIYKERNCTFLGVGPMSKHCVDATIELANEYHVPIFLIASRRQIEMAELGGGYVNNWSTEEFARYVRERDERGMVILARDHGGPWQNSIEVEKKLSLPLAMASAKKSYEADIQSGFEMIHIDPSIDVFGTPSVSEVLDRVYELYEFCYETAAKYKKKILIEFGTEEQESGTQDLEVFEHVLTSLHSFCNKNNFPKPLFAVAQTGTKVMEMKNIGTFDSPLRLPGQLPVEIQLPRTLNLCLQYNVWLKGHNTDYLSDEALSWHPKLGIHAANVAPEYGVVESRALVAVLKANGLKELAEQFLTLSYSKGKWKKWMIDGTSASDEDRAIIGGHYVFSDSRFAEIKYEAAASLKRKGIDLDLHLKNEVKRSIRRYLLLFNLIGP